MNKETDLELVEWTLDDLFSELRRISLVSEPAIESDFMMFGLTEIKFKQTDAEKRVITGPAMRPGMKIKRYRENGEAYWGYFTEEVVTKAAQLFFKRNSNSNKTNLEHDFELDGVYVFESWIVENPEIDKSKALGFSGVKKGDWFVSMKVENDILWNNYLKTGIIKGFSVEVKADEKTIDTFSLVEEILDSKMNEDWKLNAILTLIDIDAKPYVDETKKIKKEPVMGLKEGVPHYTEDGKLWTGPTHKDESGRLMTGKTHGEDSEYLYHEDELLDFKCKSQGGDGKRVNGEPDMRCPENKGGVKSGEDASRSRPQRPDTGPVKNKIPNSASTYNDIPESEYDKKINKKSLPEPANKHEKYLNNLVGNPGKIYYDGPPINTLNDAIFEYVSLTGPNANESAAVAWAKKVKFN